MHTKMKYKNFYLISLQTLDKREEFGVHCFIKILSDGKKSPDGTMSEGKNKKR